MAAVEHVNQYCVEVKNRFSLLLDTSNNEDPDLLLSKLHNQRAERSKKEKSSASATVHVDIKPEIHLEADVKDGESSTKGLLKSCTSPSFVSGKPARLPKSPKSPNASSSVTDLPKEDVIPDNSAQVPVQQVARGRGGFRGFSRGFRGRGFGPRPGSDLPSDSFGEPNPQRDSQYEPRGRGRGRPRGGFSRGRGSAYTDFRESERYNESDRIGGKPGSRRDDYGPPENMSMEQAMDSNPVECGDMEPLENGITNDGGTVEHKEEKSNEEVEEAPKMYTLEEYKAMISSTKPTISLGSKETRKANDGRDVFANMVAHRKLSEHSEEEIVEVVKDSQERPSIEIDVSFMDRPSIRGRGSRPFGGRGFDRGSGVPSFRGGGRPRGSRGPRGSFRGDTRGRGSGRGISAEQHSAPPVIYSDRDFPSLK
ncbi:Plasminogen activator inhibitor 1 RNA-binding protein [Paragonimus skrjabini miyazakii]|uniref:Plasminogen activator inhibitor 1 RNA-binding protein n=1 Tax=Paragonimus skrjabini miyazakii TaxID=59628 RepID=A0A8S9YE82_9TREM|nr:Plasminogen activator inhibitor 1 RNA-binding protein [Paragonimus skrjabini miyazakii]